MKTNTMFIFSTALSLLCVAPSIAQKGEKQVQIRIIENGKVKTDTTFSVAESVDKNDIGRISEMLNDEDVFIYKHHPGKREFVYNYGFDSIPMMKMDSLLAQNFFMFKHDSVFNLMSKRFMGDNAFMFHDFAGRDKFFRDFQDDMDDFGGISPRDFHKEMIRPDHRMIEKGTIIDDNDEEIGDPDQDDVIIHQKGPGKKGIIIEDGSEPVKTIRKKIDDETEVIIIKKDCKKVKPDKDKSRKRER